jgi:hypothetical protein
MNGGEVGGGGEVSEKVVKILQIKQNRYIGCTLGRFGNLFNWSEKESLSLSFDYCFTLTDTKAYKGRLVTL